MKIVSYNINGIRASVKAGLLDWLKEFDADVYCFQEVRCDERLAREILFGSEQINLFEDSPRNLNNYYSIFNCGEKAGYAGTLILSKYKTDKVVFNMSPFWEDNEGRTTTIFIGDIAIVDAYIPNGSSRLDFKMEYLSSLNRYLHELLKNYRVICVGDFNIAHNEIDLTNPKECKTKSVFLPIERKALSNLLDLGLIDSFRYLYPQEIKYSWRSYRSLYDTTYNSWKYRIDYILTSKGLSDNYISADILEKPYSDHLPVILNLEI